jgi:hypothetical protein
LTIIALYIWIGKHQAEFNLELDIAAAKTRLQDYRGMTSASFEHTQMSTIATATNMPGPTIIRAAVSRILCETALTELKDPATAEELDSYAKYELTPTCAEIARNAHRVSGPVLLTRNGD